MALGADLPAIALFDAFIARSTTGLAGKRDFSLQCSNQDTTKNSNATPGQENSFYSTLERHFKRFISSVWWRPRARVPKLLYTSENWLRDIAVSRACDGVRKQ